MRRKKDQSRTTTTLDTPTEPSREIICVFEVPGKKRVVSMSRPSWLKRGKETLSGAEGFWVPFIPTSEANLHIKKIRFYTDEEVQDIGSHNSRAALPLPKPVSPPQVNLEQYLGKIVGPIPFVTPCPPSRKRHRRFPRKKTTVQLLDTDRNTDIGYTADAKNSIWNRRTDLEGRDGSCALGENRDGSFSIGENIIRTISFGPDGKLSFYGLDGDLAKVVPVGCDDDSIRSYEPRIGRNCLVIPTTIKSLPRREKRKFKVLEYLQQGFPPRRIGQLMHLDEPEVRKIITELRRIGAFEPDFMRSENGKFSKS